MSSIKWIIFLIICINTLDITSFNVNFFKQSTKLFYVNAMNNENGDIYFEFWGEENAVRYFMGKNFSTEENIIINGNRICSINANLNWNFHESIIIKYNEDVNILSMNSMNFDYVNLKDNIISSKLTTQLIGNNDEGQSYRNCLIKLKNGSYLSSIILHSLSSHKIYITIFDLTSNSINSFKTIKQIYKIIGRMNSTSCFQTESSYIQCSFANVIPIDNFHVGIYDLDLNEKKTVSLGYLHDYTFTKIFHVKGEIGAYIFFDKKDNDVPKLFIKILNDDKKGLTNIFNSIEYIILNNNGRYTLDYGLFSSDAIKIDDYTFVVILTIAGDSHDLLICLCDFNNDYTSIRIKYYYLDFSLINIKVDVNLRSFVFKDYFGLLFYDSISEYPGYIYFNYPKIISENKIDSRTIKINLNLFDSISSKTFLFSEHLELINVIYTGQIKIKIQNFSYPSVSGIIIKTSSKKLSPGDIINFDEIIMFEHNITDIIPGEYFLEFYPFVEENESSSEIYGNNQPNNFEEIRLFSKDIFNLIYLVECPNDKFLYIKNEKEKYCISSCTNEDEELFTDEDENICYNNCSYATNGNNYLFNNKCISHCPLNYISNENTCILDDIHSKLSQKMKSEDIVIPLNTILHSKEITQTMKSEDIVTLSNTILPSKEISQIINPEEIINNEKESKTILSEEKISEIININKIINTFSLESNNLIKIDENSTNKCYINIDSLINNNNLEIKELEQCNNIFEYENMFMTLTTIENQKKNKNNGNVTTVDLLGCENILRNIYNISEDEIIFIKKIDFFQPGMKVPKVLFDIYRNLNSSNLLKLNLSYCSNTKIDISVPAILTESIDKHNSSSGYYNDICYTTTSDSGTDIILRDRQKEYIEKNRTICQENCIFSEYDYKIQKAKCSCNIIQTSFSFENILKF